MEIHQNNLAEEVLMHHGILGMKWGIRRYQNSDGSLTDAGRKRYGVGEKQKDHENILEKRRQKYISSETGQRNLKKLQDKYNKYVSKYDPKNKKQKEYYEKYLKDGMTSDQAKSIAYHKYKVDTALKVGATVTLAAVATGALYKYHKYASDIVIKNNVPISRITADPSGDLTHQIYAAFKPKDVEKYAGVYGIQISDVGDVYKSTYKAVGDELKIAGHKVGKETFNDMLMKNSKAKHAAKRLLEYVRDERGFVNPSQNAAVAEAMKCLSNNKPLTRKAYEGLNIAMTIDNEKAYKFNSLVADALKSKGYAGLVDVNDQKYSRYLTKAPVMLFDQTKIKQVENEVLDIDKLLDNVDKLSKKMTLQNIMKAQTELPANYVAGGAVGAALLSKDARINAKVEKYLKSHPENDKDYYELLLLAKKGKL